MTGSGTMRSYFKMHFAVKWVSGPLIMVSGKGYSEGYFMEIGNTYILGPVPKARPIFDVPNENPVGAVQEPILPDDVV